MREANPCSGLPAVLAATLICGVSSCDGSNGAEKPIVDTTPITPPDLRRIAPPAAIVTGGTRLRVEGEGFDAGVLQVSIGGKEATDIFVEDDEVLTCTIPSGNPGFADVSITTQNGTVVFEDGLRYHNELTVSTVDPPIGHVDGETVLTIRGAGFDQGIVGVRIGDRAATVPIRIWDYELKCTTPEGALGAQTVTVITESGEFTLENGFTYVPSPAVLSVHPSSGFSHGDDLVTVRGSRLQVSGGHTEVEVGNVEVTALSLTPLSFSFYTPPRPAVLAAVRVRNVLGPSNPSAAFQYFGLPMQIGATDTRVDANALQPIGHDIAFDDDRIYVVWSGKQNGEGDSDVWFNWSDDEGATFQPQDIRVDRAPAGSESTNPRIAIEDQSVYVVWEDDRDGESDIYISRSTDRGATWGETDTRVGQDAAGSSASHTPHVLTAANVVHIAWTDARDGRAEIYYSRSIDSGETFSVERRLDSDPGAAASRAVELAASEGHVYAVWEDTRGGTSEIRLNASGDSGRTWLAADVRIDANSPPTAVSTLPQITSVGDSVAVAWNSTRNGAPGVWANRSTDGGQTWLPAEHRIDRGTPNLAAPPRIAADGQLVCVVWEDLRDGASDVYCNRSLDRGANWGLLDARLDGGAPGASESHSLQLGIDGRNVFVAWTAQRDESTAPRGDVQVLYSTDRAATWAQSELRFNTSLVDATAEAPRLVCDGARVFVLWNDNRYGLGHELRLNRSVP